MITHGSEKDSGVAVGSRKTYLISRSTANLATKVSGSVWDENDNKNVLRARSRSSRRTRTERTGMNFCYELASAGVVMELSNLLSQVEHHQRRESSRQNLGVRCIRRKQKIAVIAVGDGQLVVE